MKLYLMNGGISCFSARSMMSRGRFKWPLLPSNLSIVKARVGAGVHGWHCGDE